MKTILETTLEDPEEAVIFQQLLNEMGYKTHRYTRLDAADGRKHKLSETRLAILMMNHARKSFNGRPFTADDFEALLTNNYYSFRSAAMILSGLTTEGVLYRVDRGVYQLTEKIE